jgi:isopentenyl diphosphate isomerase/L-lactate dehydrogenase-like FMN-dependent dehydrogenase
MAAKRGQSREDSSAPEVAAVDHNDAILDTVVAAAEVLINSRRLNDHYFIVILSSGTCSGGAVRDR